MRLPVRVTPKGGRDRIDGWAEDATGRPYLRLRVSAAPADGAANEAVVILIAKTLARPKSTIRILSGHTSRLKVLEIDGFQEDELMAAFATARER